MNRSFVIALVCVLFSAACPWCGRAVAPNGSMRNCLSCSGLFLLEDLAIQDRFARIGDLLGDTWDVLGILRSITIAPPYRVRFLNGVVDHAAGLLQEVARLALSCDLAVGHCKNFLVAFEDVGERFAGVKEAFNAVCLPACSGEERVIGAMVERASLLFDACWASALKVDATFKSDQ